MMLQILIFSPIEFFCGRRVEGGCTQVKIKLPKSAKNVVLLITFDAPMTAGITCVSMATFVRAKF